MMSDEKKVTAEVTIAADADAVWRALSEGEELKRWFPPDARVNPGAGGSIWLSWGEGMDWEAPIEIWEPQRHLRTVDPPPGKAAVDYFIESKGGETVLRIVQSGFAAETWDDELDTLNAGWRTFAETLKHYLERHRGVPRTLAFYRHPVVPLPRSEVFPRMLEALGVTPVGEGERFRGPLFEGVARVVKPPVNFSGPLENYGDGFLMIEIEPGRDRCRPAVWVSLYGDAGREAPELTKRLRNIVDQTFTI
jgi:uncharacterized protein YndB with AHSA1/START domain